MRFFGAITFLFAASTALASPLILDPLGLTKNATGVESEIKDKIRTGLTDITHALHLDQLAPQWTGQSSDQDDKPALPDFSKLLLSPNQINTIGKDVVDITKTLIQDNAFSPSSVNINPAHAIKIAQDNFDILNVLNLGNLLPKLPISLPSQSPNSIANATLSDIKKSLADIIKNADLLKEVPELFEKLGGGQ